MMRRILLLTVLIAGCHANDVPVVTPDQQKRLDGTPIPADTFYCGSDADSDYYVSYDAKGPHRYAATRDPKRKHPFPHTDDSSQWVKAGS